MPGKTQRKLVDIDLSEISGVDYPAHLLNGFAVVKNAGGDVIEADDAVEKALFDEGEEVGLVEKASELLQALESAAQGYLAEAPEEVKAAANVLYDYLMADPEMGDSIDAPEEDDEESGDVSKGIWGKFVQFLRGEVAKDHKPGHDAEADGAQSEDTCPECGGAVREGKCMKCGKEIGAVAKELDAVEIEVFAKMLRVAAEADPTKQHDIVTKAVTDLIGEEEQMSEHIERLVKAIEDSLGAPVEAVATEPIEPEAIAKAVAEAVSSDIETLTKANETFSDVLERVLNRLEAVEKAVSGSKQPAGQEVVRKSADPEGEGTESPEGNWHGVVKALTADPRGVKVVLGG